MRTLLEFEKPIAELEDKLIEMRKLALENNVDVSGAVARGLAAVADSLSRRRRRAGWRDRKSVV
mgnify:CR=1 FL=1